MISVVIKGPTFDAAHKQISQALECADLVELRLDSFDSVDIASLERLRSYFSIPMIFTLRSPLQGGSYSKSEESRLNDLRRLSALKPEYLDLENFVDPYFIEEISSMYPEIKLIISYHNFEKTPENLDELYREMQKLPAYFYKIAVTPLNSLDTMRFMCWAHKNDGKLIGICMGSYGQISRILGPLLGCQVTYASLEENQKTAPGQLSAKTLIERYHHRSLNSKTAVYGLIGDPIDGSISDETHNALMATCGLNAVYVKIQLAPSEIADFLKLARQLPFQGFSVTMPLKEHILPFIDHIDSEAISIGAVNTLLFKQGKICGFNTDGVGALNAIEKESLVKDKRIVIIGTGGAAKAIAFEAMQRGGVVTIVNRDAKKADQIAEHLHCTGKGIEWMAECVKLGYDILINCTPAAQPIEPDYILPKTIVMDITTKPKDTAFLELARKKGCRIVYGYTMFVEQALGQFDLWFKDPIDVQKCRKILEDKSIESVFTSQSS